MNEIICQNCKQEKAVVHLTDIKGDQKVETHLCLACAHKLGVAYQTTVSLSSLSELLSQVTAEGQEQPQEVPDITCEVCSMSLAEFQKEGRFGCANDYAVFREHIMPLLERVHDGTSHMGKVPRSAGDDVKAPAEVRALRAKLQAAVGEEDYEEAARLRDELAKKLGDAGGPES